MRRSLLLPLASPVVHVSPVDRIVATAGDTDVSTQNQPPTLFWREKRMILEIKMF
jgi:hypothetical protein